MMVKVIATVVHENHSIKKRFIKLILLYFWSDTLES